MESDTESPTLRLTARAPIFVTGCARSGTTLFTRLLDGHPDVLVFPIELKYFRYRAIRTDYPTVRLARLTDVRDVVRAIAESDYVGPLRGAPDSIGGRDDAVAAIRNAIDTDRFREASRRLNGINTHADGIVHFFAALGESIGMDREDLANVRFVEKSPYQEENVDELISWFPDARFVHLVRNPYAVMVSEREGGVAQYMKIHAAAMQRSSLRRAIRNREVYGDRYQIVRYEDLVSRPETVMRDTVTALGLEDHSALREPTILGQRWRGNSSSGQRFVGISPSAADRWKARIFEIEVGAVNRFLSAEMAHFHYERLATPPLTRVIAQAFRKDVRSGALNLYRSVRSGALNLYRYASGRRY